MPTDNGYSNQKKKGLAQFETVHNLGSSAYGKVITPKSLYEITASAAIVSVTDIKGSNGLVEYWNIELTAHGASVGNVLRIDAGSLINTEYEIIQVIDVDNFYILPITDVKPAPADTGIIMGWVTQKLASDGSINVAITSAPTSYNLDGSPQTVEQDTVTPANNRALPNLNFIYKDGVQVPITKDTGIPSNTVGMPVEIVAASGTPINITAGDLNVQLSDQGANYDSTRIGDGTNLLGITASNEAKVSDANALVALQALVAKDFSTAAKQDLAKAVLDSILTAIGVTNGKDFATQTTLASVLVDTTAIKNKNFATETTLATVAKETTIASVKTAVELLDDTVNTDASPAGTKGLMIGGIDGSGDFQRVSVNTAGELSVTFGSAGFATETTLASLNTKHNANYGASSGAIRTASQIGNTTGAADFNAGADSAQTLRVSANLKRAGNELSYNAGTVDANTLRVIPASNYTPPAPAVPTALTVKQAALTVGTSAVRLTHDAAAPSATRRKLQFIIEPGGADNFFVGSSSVTSSGATRGIRVYPGTLYTYDNDAGNYYIISDTAAQTVFVIEQE